MLTVPLSLVKAAPLMEYVPPAIEMYAVEMRPDTVMALDVIGVFKATFVRSVKWNVSGVVAECVVTLKVSDTVPTVSVALFVVEQSVDEVFLTLTVLPLLTVPPALVKAAPLMEYVPPTIEMFVAEPRPDIVMALDVIGVFRSIFI